MNIRGFLSRALIALSIALGAAGASQAQPAFIGVGGEIAAFGLEVRNAVVNDVAGTSFWARLLEKAEWARVGTRVGTLCVVAGLGAVAYDSATTHRTWYVKGIRGVSACGIGMLSAAMFEIAQTTLLAAEVSTLVALSGGLAMAGIITTSALIVTELIWQAHTLGNKTARPDPNGGNFVTVPRRTLKIYKDEYLDHTQGTRIATNRKHPESSARNGTSISLSNQIGTQDVGGQRKYIDTCGKPCM